MPDIMIYGNLLRRAENLIVMITSALSLESNIDRRFSHSLARMLQ